MSNKKNFSRCFSLRKRYLGGRLFEDYNFRCQLCGKWEIINKGIDINLGTLICCDCSIELGFLSNPYKKAHENDHSFREAIDKDIDIIYNKIGDYIERIE